MRLLGIDTSQYLDVLSGEIEKNLYKIFIYIIYRFYTDVSLFRQIKRQDTVDTSPSLNDIMEIRCNKCTRSEQGYNF
jgi:hypothetical protein